MLTRNFLRQSRSIITPLSTHATSATPLHQSQKPLQTLLSSQIPAPTRARIQTRRWHALSATAARRAETAATDEKTNDSTSTTDQGAPSGEAAEATEAQQDPVKAEMEKKDKEIIELKDRYLRSVADFRNLQDRSRREQAAARDYGIQRFARDLIESVDNLDLALANVPPEKLVAPASASSDLSSSPQPPQQQQQQPPSDADAQTQTASAPDPNDPYKDLRQLHNGLSMTNEILLSTLKKHGLERFDPSAASEKFDPNMHEATFQTPVQGKDDGTCFYTTQKGFKLNGRVIRAAKVGVVKNA